MRVLIFCPTVRVHPDVLAGLLGQKNEQIYFDIMLTRDNPTHAYKNIQINYDKLRTVTKDYDKVWIVEDDMLVPDDALEKLLSVDAPVVSGVYVLRHGVEVVNLYKAQKASPEVGEPIPWRQLAKMPEVIEVSGGCMGCLLVDSEVVQGFDWINPTSYVHAPDVEFARHCWKNGIKQMAHLGVLCGHKKPTGGVLWPQTYMEN